MSEYRKKKLAEEEQNERSLLSKIKPSSILAPIIIGLSVVAYMIYKEVDVTSLSLLNFTTKSIILLFGAILCMLGRDFGYMWRMRILSSKELSWHQVFRIIMLWEFTSAVTPSAVGGTSIAVVYVHKEGLSVGKSTSIVMLTSFFDELYFIIMFPLTILIIGSSELFSVHINNSSFVGSSIMVIAVIGYFLKLAFLLLVSYGLFINPKGLKYLIILIFKLPYLRKFRNSAAKVGDDLIISSKEIKHKSFMFWVKASFATFISWSSRYLVINAIILAFFAFHEHFMLFARQLVMWISMLIMPTPGGSGFSEFLFKEYLGEFIPVSLEHQIGIAAVLALIWRIVTYYPYLIIGAIMLPRWIKSKFITK
ncbi:MAG: lysylphosphatidylglycerol synthase transmembrane domain-containing protein [Rikenellaceae bacterium]